jgi:hypothetical protein
VVKKRGAEGSASPHAGSCGSFAARVTTNQTCSKRLSQLRPLHRLVGRPSCATKYVTSHARRILSGLGNRKRKVFRGAMASSVTSPADRLCSPSTACQATDNLGYAGPITRFLTLPRVESLNGYNAVCTRIGWNALERPCIAAPYATRLGSGEHRTSPHRPERAPVRPVPRRPYDGLAITEPHISRSTDARES